MFYLVQVGFFSQLYAFSYLAIDRLCTLLNIHNEHSYSSDLQIKYIIYEQIPVSLFQMIEFKYLLINYNCFSFYFSPFIRPKLGKLHEASCMVRLSLFKYERANK